MFQLFRSFTNCWDILQNIITDTHSWPSFLQRRIAIQRQYGCPRSVDISKFSFNFFTVSITWSNNFLLASSIYSGIWHTCTNGVNNGCRKSAYGQEILPPIMSGKVTTHAAITYGRVNVRARVPKGAFIWPGLFYIKKTAIKTVFELHVFFLWIHIVVLSPF